MNRSLRFAFVSLLFLLAATSFARSNQSVDVALVLAVDVSRSMSPEELLLQRKGYAAAISSPEVVRAIELGAHGRIALTIFEWANVGHKREIAGWAIIETQQDADVFATRILETESFGQRRTSISGAIRHASRLFQKLPFKAERHVIDISGDGPNNQGGDVTRARDAALGDGLIINGLPLMTRSGFGQQFNIEDLDEYYRRCVIGGPGSFMIPVNDWAQFPEAVRRKLILEIGGFVPHQPARVMHAQLTFQQPYDCQVGEKIWQRLREQYFLDP
ncbi:MAG: DUF1194 domain-containing protein [Roseibium sp.]